ncbi:MAG: hypothetical protein HUJ64_05270, partial [Limosilactobacillus mucosae]|nr:hypothetical protein [Limosilactobacillus mucosae]
VVLALVFQHSLTSEQIAARSATLPPESYLGAELTGPVDVSSSFDAARPEWSFRALYQMTKLPIFSKIGMVYAIFVVPPIFLICFFAFPILGRSKILHYCIVCSTLILFCVICNWTYKSYWLDYSPDSEHYVEFQKGLADAHRTADRAVELAFAPNGIPKTGALTLIKDDPYLKGPVLFNQHCASCHNFKPKDESVLHADYVEIECQDPTAPNLYGCRTAEWIRGFTNEATLADNDYFGKTAFATKGSMIGFMKGRVAGGLFIEDGSFILNGNGLIATVIASDSSPAYDIMEAVFEDFCSEEENLELLESVLNEDDDLDDETVESARNSYIAKLKLILEQRLTDSEFISELDPKLPEPVMKALKSVLIGMLDDEDYIDLIFDEESVELVMDESYDEFLTDVYLAQLNGNDEPIPATHQKYINI